MLKSVDVLIGLVVVLLALSMAVTVITQSVTAIVNSRGSHLRRGLMDLLKLVDPKLPADACSKIATAVLKHPLVSGSSGFGVIRLGNVVHREEFTKLLLGLAEGDPDVNLDQVAQKQLIDALKRNGIDKPDEVLKDIRTAALALERSNPDLAHSVRQSLAIVKATQSDFVAKIHTWFDQSIDRTAQRFTASTRVITFVGGLIVAVVLQVNTLSIANRLAADDRLREAFVAQATQLQAQKNKQATETNRASRDATTGDKRTGGSAAGAATTEDRGTKGSTTENTLDPDQQDREMERQYRAFLAENGIIRFPTSWNEWREGIKSPTIPGILITALLLSLGAPFWYNVLGKLLQLRSDLAFKDDAQREERQDEGRSAAKGTSSAANKEGRSL